MHFPAVDATLRAVDPWPKPLQESAKGPTLRPCRAMREARRLPPAEFRGRRVSRTSSLTSNRRKSGVVSAHAYLENGMNRPATAEDRIDVLRSRMGRHGRSPCSNGKVK